VSDPSPGGSCEGWHPQHPYTTRAKDASARFSMNGLRGAKFKKYSCGKLLCPAESGIHVPPRFAERRNNRMIFMDVNFGLCSWPQSPLWWLGFLWYSPMLFARRGCWGWATIPTTKPE